MHVSRTALWLFILAAIAMITRGEVPIANVSPHVNNFEPDFTACNPGTYQSVSGRTLALAASANRQRMYAGTFAGVWRSDTGGQTWRSLDLPQPPADAAAPDIEGALFAPIVTDLAVSAQSRCRARRRVR
jgi:hypothetical protein